VIIRQHFCAPPGEATRRIITQLLNVQKDDNRLLLSALMANKVDIPDTMWDLGLRYEPPAGAELNSPQQDFYSLIDLLDQGTFSCGDAAAYEAAVQEEKYGKPCFCMCVAQGSNEYHAIYVSTTGPVDPTENWLKKYAENNGQLYMGADAGADRWGGLL